MNLDASKASRRTPPDGGAVTQALESTSAGDVEDLQRLLAKYRSDDPGLEVLVAAAVRRHALLRELGQRRKELGLTQDQVAAAMGTSQAAVARLEQGRADPRASTIERFAAVLGVRINAAIADDDDAVAAYREVLAAQRGEAAEPPWRQLDSGGWSEPELQAAMLSTDPDLVARAAFSLARHLADKDELDEAEVLYTQAWRSGHREVAPKAALVVAYFAAQRHDPVLAKEAADWAEHHGDQAVQSQATVLRGRLHAVSRARR